MTERGPLSSRRRPGAGAGALLVVGLLMASSGVAQEADSPHTKQNYVKTIDHFPLLPDRGAARTTTQVPLAPLEDTFELHSHPGANKRIYLDFDGHTTGGFVYDAWNMEGADTDFSDAERTIIQLAWQSVSEDFLPFDVDVTTEFPGIEALKNSGGGDQEWGIRAVVNHTTYGYSWAYNGSFNDSEDIELFVWSGPYDTTFETWVWIADSIAHEAGHSLGLNHDGTTTGIEYYPGHGEGITAWSPIMGWTNYGLSQWSKGEYTNANNPEDDLEIITTRNGFGYRADDHGETLSTATPVAIDQPFVVEGIIEQPTDVDTFAFTVASDGDVLLTIRPDNLAPNLDILATLSDAEGEVLHTSNPPDALHVAFDVFLEAGDYYLSVDGVGHEDPDSDGYSDYGTLGYYQVTPGAEGDFGDEDEDADGDGYAVADGDCDDGDPEVHPGALEQCDGQGIDEDCDGAADGQDLDCALGASLEARGACGCRTGSPLGSAWVLVLAVLCLRRRGAREPAGSAARCRPRCGGE